MKDQISRTGLDCSSCLSTHVSSRVSAGRQVSQSSAVLDSKRSAFSTASQIYSLLKLVDELAIGVVHGGL